jgi:hypothetical protein
MANDQPALEEAIRLRDRAALARRLAAHLFGGDADDVRTRLLDSAADLDGQATEIERSVDG